MADTPTPRQVQISQRGVVVRGVDLVMQVLQSIFPRRVFPEQASGDREPVLGDPWCRGGTSPGGASFAGPVDGPGALNNAHLGNYFIGWADEKVDSVEPQRVVWTPPEPGQERFGPAQLTGFVVDQATAPGALPVLRPAGPQDYAAPPTQVPRPTGTPVAYSTQVGRLQRDVGQQAPGSAAQPHPGATYGHGGRVMGAPHVTAWCRTRVVPMTAHLWGSDWDDTEELGMHLESAAECAMQGTAAHMGLAVVESAGWVRDDKGSRGMHYVVVVNFACPIIWPAQGERELLGFGTRVAFAPALDPTP